LPGRPRAGGPAPGGPATLQLLRYLVERTAGRGCWSWGRCARLRADRSAQLVEAISSLYALDGVRRLDLAGLDTEAVADYLVVEGGVRVGRRAFGAVLLRDATGGNPFFLREVWRDLSARGGLPALGAGGLPGAADVLDTMQGRLARLGQRERLVVEAAAVLGDTVDVPTARAGGRGHSEDTLAALDAAVSLGLIMMSWAS
jgi:hypothetical protein